MAAARAPRVSGRVQDMRTLHENVDSATYELEYTYAKERQTRPCGRPTTTTSIGMRVRGCHARAPLLERHLTSRTLSERSRPCVSNAPWHARYADPASDSAARERSPLAWCALTTGSGRRKGGEEWGVGGDRGVDRVVISSSTLCILEPTSEVHL